jgi:hypothetical protein
METLPIVLGCYRSGHCLDRRRVPHQHLEAQDGPAGCWCLSCLVCEEMEMENGWLVRIRSHLLGLFVVKADTVTVLYD